MSLFRIGRKQYDYRKESGFIMNETIETIMNRRSIREYSQKHISDEELDTILAAGMSGPTCVNANDWYFIVVRDKETMQKMADANGRPARKALSGADVAILVCGDLDRAFKGAPDYWIIDGAIAGQNMILAAASMGIGSVWLGTYPQMDRVKNQAKLFDLPDSVVPHSVIAFGYPKEGEEIGPRPLDNPHTGTPRVPGRPGAGPVGPRAALTEVPAFSPALFCFIKNLQYRRAFLYEHERTDRASSRASA